MRCLCDLINSSFDKLLVFCMIILVCFIQIFMPLGDTAARNDGAGIVTAGKKTAPSANGKEKENQKPPVQANVSPPSKRPRPQSLNRPPGPNTSAQQKAPPVKKDDKPPQQKKVSKPPKPPAQTQQSKPVSGNSTSASAPSSGLTSPEPMETGSTPSPVPAQLQSDALEPLSPSVSAVSSLANTSSSITTVVERNAGEQPGSRPDSRQMDFFSDESFQTSTVAKVGKIYY